MMRGSHASVSRRGRDQTQAVPILFLGWGSISARFYVSSPFSFSFSLPLSFSFPFLVFALVRIFLLSRFFVLAALHQCFSFLVQTHLGVRIENSLSRYAPGPGNFPCLCRSWPCRALSRQAFFGIPATFPGLSFPTRLRWDLAPPPEKPRLPDSPLHRPDPYFLIWLKKDMAIW